jgi:hypothetical protein
MIKKIVKIFGGLIAFVLLLIVIASVAVMLYVNKGLVEDQMRKALNRHVQIQDIRVGIFSIVSGFEVKKVAISNFKTERQLEALKGKPVPPGDVFVSMESMRLKLKFLPLLKKQFVLKEFVMYTPTINIAKSKEGAFNFDDLLRPKKLTKEDQKFQVYKLTTIVSDIAIDPKELDKKNSAKLKLFLGVRTVGPMKSGSVESFDVTGDIEGTVMPFDLKTRKLDPEVSLHVGSPEGQLTGLQIFNTIAGNNILAKYLGDALSFLKGKQSWKGSKLAYVDVWYKGEIAKLSNGNLKLRECRLLFQGTTNIKTKVMDVPLELETLKERTSAIKVGLRRQIESGLKRLGAKKYANPEKIADTALKPLLNKNGMVYMKFKVSGTTNKPVATLTYPQLGSLDDIIKRVAGDVLMEAGKEAGKKAIEDGGKRLLKKAPKIKIF